MDRDFFDKNPEIREIFNHMGDAVYFIDSQGAILFMNKAAENLDGYRLQEVRGRTVKEMYGLDETKSPLLRVASTKKPLYDHTFRYYVNNQEVFQICNTFPIELEDGACGAFSIQRDVTKLKHTIDRNIELQKKLFDYGGNPQNGDKTFHTFEDIIGEHQLLLECKNLAYNAAQSDSPIMLTGLTGTGKELFAQSIHSVSRRRNKTFLAINCAAIPETLLESILFGTVKGIYTGATERKGLFEEANGGTLFLDEINSMPLASQAKLLRVLEEKMVQPLGSKDKIKIDTRIISSCNLYPQEAINKNQIRQDLFYRLAVINIMIPSLQQRKSDIFLLAHHFIAKYNEEYKKNVLAMEDDVTTFFLNYHWPGNVRQLRYCIECAMNLINPKETTIKEKHLPYYLKENKDNSPQVEYYQEFQNLESEKQMQRPVTSEPHPTEDATDPPQIPANSPQITFSENLLENIKDQEKQKIAQALINSQGCISKAARELGLTRQTLTYRMKKHGLK